MKTNEIWLERKDLLDKLYLDTKTLIKWRIPVYHRVMYWEKIFDRFVSQIIKQDRKIDKNL